MVVGFDPVHSRSVQRSFTVHGDNEAAEQLRRELVDDFGISRIAFASEASRLTVAELLKRFFAAPLEARYRGVARARRSSSMTKTLPMSSTRC